MDEPLPAVCSRRPPTTERPVDPGWPASGAGTGNDGGRFPPRPTRSHGVISIKTRTSLLVLHAGGVSAGLDIGRATGVHPARAIWPLCAASEPQGQVMYSRRLRRVVRHLRLRLIGDEADIETDVDDRGRGLSPACLRPAGRRPREQAVEVDVSLWRRQWLVRHGVLRATSGVPRVSGMLTRCRGRRASPNESGPRAASNSANG